MKYLWHLICLWPGLLTRLVHHPLKTTGHKRTHFTCVMACTASGQKLPLMVIFRCKTMPKEQLQKGIVVTVNTKGWMMEGLMKEWLTKCYGKCLGGFFSTGKEHCLFWITWGLTSQILWNQQSQKQTPFQLWFLQVQQSICSHLTSVLIGHLKLHSGLSGRLWWQVLRSFSQKLAACKKHPFLMSLSGS